MASAPYPVFPVPGATFASFGAYVDSLVERLGELEDEVMELRRDVYDLKAKLDETRSPILSQAPSDSSMSHT